MTKIKNIGDILRSSTDELFEILASDEVIGGDELRRIALAQFTRRIKDESYLEGMKKAGDVAEATLRSELNRILKGKITSEN